MTAALLLLCALLYLPGLLALPPVDRDEARFAQATRQMVETGDYVSIRFQDEPRDKKPVGIYWAQAACINALQSLAGEDAIWPYRLPSVLGATLAVWLLYFFLRPHLGEAISALAAALLASSTLLTAEAHLATTDALLLACVVAAQGALMRRVLTPDSRPLAHSMCFWIAQALAILIKGPIAPLVSIMTLIAWRLSGSRLRPLTLLHAWIGLPVVLLITLPWAIATSTTGEGSFLVNAIASDLLPKLVSGQESHGFPPGYYLLLLTVTFWPGSLLTGFALRSAWKNRSLQPIRFLYAWLVPSWITFELVPTKLPHYVLPLYPALAAITAFVTLRWSKPFGRIAIELPRRGSLLVGWAIWSVVTLAIGAAIVALPILIDGRFDAITLIPMLGAIISVGLGAALVRRTDASLAVGAALAGCSALVLAPTLSLVLPRVRSLWPSRLIADVIDAQPDQPDLPWAAVGFHEPSLVFGLGTDTQLLGPIRAAEAMAAGSVRGVIIEHGQREAFDARANELHLSLESIGDVRGVNISKGEWIDVSILVIAPQAEAP